MFFFFFSVDCTIKAYILFKEKKEREREREREREKDRRRQRGETVEEKERGLSVRESFNYVWSYQVSLMIFNLLTKMSLNNVT